MRVFQVANKDNKTGLEIKLSECSYNEACYWLERVYVKTQGMEVYRAEMNRGTGLTEIWMGRPAAEATSPNWMRKFYYDEERGYLLTD